MFRPKIKRAGLTLRIDAPPLPKPVQVDPQMWTQIIDTLLATALNGATGDGTITVSLRTTAGQAELTVAGVGTAVGDTEKASTSPVQTSGPRAVPEAPDPGRSGNSVGLSRVAELVAAHGGSIHADRTPHDDSIVTVRIPTSQPDAARRHSDGLDTEPPVMTSGHPGPDAPVADTDDRPRPDAVDNSPRLLVVEEHAHLRAYLSQLLRQDGWTVEAVPSAEAALAVTTAPDLILSGILLPGRDGLGLLRAVRADPAYHDVPIVLLTALAGGCAVAAGLRAGANDYLVKPVDPVELLARVRMHYELARRLRHAQRQTQNLQTALSSNRATSYAIGILMAQRKLTAEQSFELLRTCARHAGRKLHEVADEVVHTGALPARAPRAAGHRMAC